MLSRSFINSTRNMFRISARYQSNIAGEAPEVDYFEILGLERTATPQEIKRAYRTLAKKYHPDVNVQGINHDPNAEKFRKISEAYAILSVPENREKYGLATTEESAEFDSIKSATMEASRKQRDRSGHVPGPVPLRGSYAEFRMRSLENERKKYNVNHLGYYNGGLPQKGKQNIRGSAMKAPGEFHDAYTHNIYERREREAFDVTSLQADAYKNLENMDEQLGRDRVRPYHTIEEDPDMKYVKNRKFATMIIFGIFGWAILKRIYIRETMRAQRNARTPENLEKAPAHHFVNRGGVLIKKEVVGFAKYFKNDKELTDWYHKVYPDIMNEEAPSS